MMRNDMYKVIVERPRRGGGFASERRVDDLEESPRCEGLRKRHRSRKWFNENLRPLERYLAGQVGRPWSKVYGEICANIDRRNTVQQHIHQHLDDFVAMPVVEVDGVLSVTRHWGGLAPLTDPWTPRFYVCPRTGLLRENKAHLQARRDLAHRRREATAAVHPDRRILDPWRQLHRIGGCWFQVELALLAEAGTVQAKPMDVLRRLAPADCPQWHDANGVASNRTLFGRHDIYAWHKRQLGGVELRAHGLTNRND